MNKLAYYKGYMEKEALDISDLEDRMGIYIDDKYEDEARDYLNRAKNESFALKHPWLTGIPTLGIAPAIAKEKALDKAQRYLIRKHSPISQRVAERQQQKADAALEKFRLETERRKAEQAERVVGQLGSLGLRGLDRVLDAKEGRRKYRGGYGSFY